MVAFALLASACGNDRGALRVDFRSDLESVVEVSNLTIELERVGLERFVVEPGTRLRRGLTVARFEAVDAGEYDVGLTLFRPDGSALGERRVRARVNGESVVTLVYTRSCLSVVCPAGDPAATECNNGVCVPPECSPENPDACGSSACASGNDCPVSAIACAQATCDEGVCLLDAVDEACGPDEMCSVVEGCVPSSSMVDAGLPDMGAPDTEPPDTGPPDTGPPDTGPPCNEGASCDTGRACEEGVISCRSGEPVCVVARSLDEGTPCPTCNEGCLVVAPAVPYACEGGMCDGSGCCVDPG